MKRKRRSTDGYFRLRVLLGGVFLLAGLSLVLTGFAVPSNASSSGTDRSNFLPKIAAEVLQDTANGAEASVVIFLADQADVNPAYGIKDQDARGWYVYNTLTEHAARTQASLRSFLTSNGVTFQSFWVANMIVATINRPLVESLASRTDVARIDSNKPARWIENPEVASFEVTDTHLDGIETAEWGVTNVNAPSVWALGFNGTGIVIANQDTGMRWTHSALKPKYRGWNGVAADHNFNWHDSIHSGGGSCGPNNLAPCDDDGHGTHTTGTTIGDDGAGNQVGVAPGAKWIGCRNMDQGNGTPATYSECFQFFMAPTDLTGNNANPTLRPHVMNNSWGCPVSEGCVTGSELEAIVNNTQASGIFVEVSAGNSGSGCSTVSDAPAMYNASFSTGAISITNALASFSSRGPSTFYTPSILKPNVSAPGVNVRSSTRTSDTSFGTLSGTSMAGPHVVGVVALLWSARPQLVRDIAATKALLQSTANPNVTLTAQTCGGTPSSQIPNNSFGYGRVDVLAAVNATAPTPTPGGTAPPSPTPAPTATPTASPTASPPGTVSISGSISYCSNPAPSPVANVTLSLTGSSSNSTSSDSSGSYVFTALSSGGSFTVTPSKTPLTAGSKAINTIDVIATQRHFLQIVLLTGCRLQAGDTNGDSIVNTQDVIAIQRFFLSQSTGTANVGKYTFAPSNRTYSGIVTNQAGENYDAFVVGDVTAPFPGRPSRSTRALGPESLTRAPDMLADRGSEGQPRIYPD